MNYQSASSLSLRLSNFRVWSSCWTFLPDGTQSSDIQKRSGGFVRDAYNAGDPIRDYWSSSKQGTVVDMDSFKAILRYNDYKNDPISNGNPYNAICSRGDLAGKASGCYDTKVTSWSWFQQQKSSIINGPTQSHGLPPFSWKEQNGKYEDITHEGQPDVFDFDFQDEYFSDSLQWKSYA